MIPPGAGDLWWKDAIIYCLDVETFLDSDGDGCGDLDGLAARIGYLADLGVSCLWLMPFYASPNLDDGYDITDYYAVQPALGSPGDFVELLRIAHDRGLRVIVDLVVNHTSDQHPWFQAARSDRNSPFRDFYVWRDEIPEGPQPEPVFPDAEDGVWTYDEVAGQNYLHHFYRHQPDLNISNPAVWEELERIAGFWLALGVNGFRVDAVPFLVEPEPGGPKRDPHELVKRLRNFVNRRRGDALLLGEVNLTYDGLSEYFGHGPGDELVMQFDFPLMQLTYLAFARDDATPVVEALRQRPAIPPTCQWANFLRNHDELTLDKLDERQRDEVFAAFAPEEGMRLFGRGIRRRLPSMFEGDQARLRLAYLVMFGLPGSPVLFYGEEIGMAENLEIPGRRAVRTPMQWSGARNGGFSTARAEQLVRPVVTGPFGPERVNVEAQVHDGDSLLCWMRRILRIRRDIPEFGSGACSVLDPGHASVLAVHLWLPGFPSEPGVVTLSNLSPHPVPVDIPLPVETDGDMGARDVLDPRGARWPLAGRLKLDLAPYEGRWIRLERSPRF